MPNEDKTISGSFWCDDITCTQSVWTIFVSLDYFILTWVTTFFSDSHFCYPRGRIPSSSGPNHCSARWKDIRGMFLWALYDAAPQKLLWEYYTYILYVCNINGSLRKYKGARNTEIIISQGKRLLSISLSLSLGGLGHLKAFWACLTSSWGWLIKQRRRFL